MGEVCLSHVSHDPFPVSRSYVPARERLLLPLGECSRRE